MREREAALARKAERQYGVFSGSQAQEAGFPRRTIYERVRRGSWVRVCGDSYRVAASAETWQQPIVAAWLAVGDPSAISGRSALAVWQLATPMPAVPQITVPWTRRPRLTGVRVVRTRRWTRKDIVRMGTLRVTSVRRTLLDVAPHFSELDLETVVDAAHRRKLLDLEQVAAYLRKARKAKIPGASKLAFLVGLRVGNVRSKAWPRPSSSGPSVELGSPRPRLSTGSARAVATVASTSPTPPNASASKSTAMLLTPGARPSRPTGPDTTNSRTPAGSSAT